MSEPLHIPGVNAAGDAVRYKRWLLEQAANERVSEADFRTIQRTDPARLLDAAHALSNMRETFGAGRSYGVPELVDHLRRIGQK